MALADELEHAGKEAGAEYALTVSFVLREELLWQSRGMRSHSDRRFLRQNHLQTVGQSAMPRQNMKESA